MCSYMQHEKRKKKHNCAHTILFRVLNIHFYLSLNLVVYVNNFVINK